MAELTPASLDDHEQQRVAELLADGPAELRLTSLRKDERGLTASAGRRHQLRIDPWGDSMVPLRVITSRPS